MSPEEGAAFARERECLYKETSAKTDCGGQDEHSVYDALVWGMVCTILDTPGLVGTGGGSGGSEVRLGAGGGDRRQQNGPFPCCS